MSSADRDRPRRGGPGSRQRRRGQGWDGQVWNGQGWNGQGWFGEPGGRPQQHGWGGDWHGRGWSGEWRAAAWNTERPDAASDDEGRDTRWDDADRNDAPPEQPRSGRKRVRIGDAERDRAVSMLSEHFVAGRLTQAEFEERSEVVTRARYADDLEPLFDDLPASTELQVAPAPAALRRRPGPPPFLMLAPFLMIGLVVTSVALTAPWLLWGMFWIILISGMSRRRHYR